MEAVPAATPETTPDELTLALEGKVLAQVPPVVVLANVMVLPAQTVVGPVSGAGDGLTVRKRVEVHVLRLYVTLTAPADTPVTIPVVELIVAIEVFETDHVPPATTAPKLGLKPTHTVDGP